MPEAQPLDHADHFTQKLKESDRAHETFAAHVDEKASISAVESITAAAVEEAVGEQSDVYDFDAFIQRMRHPSCKPVLESIKR